MDIDSEEGRFRRLSGPLGRFASVVLAAPVIIGCLWALEAHHWVGLLVFKEQFLAVMLALGLIATFLLVRPAKQARADRVAWFDWILAAAALATSVYVIAYWREIIFSSTSLTADRITFSAIAVLLVFEATRRLIGLTLVAIAVFFMLYARFGDLMPGVLAVPPSRLERVTVYAFLDTNGLFGTPLTVAATMIITFILFGAILKVVRGDRFITDLALVGMGRYRGGPAKVSVGASTLFGTVSGSAVSNVSVVGPISIPMMHEAGYPKHQAAAIEAVSSTGGQIMPPVMGITAFIMADFLAIPYSDVVLAALIPALLYYFAVFAQVDLEAARRGLKGLPAERIPRLWAVLREGYPFVVPLAILIYTVMFAHWTPGRAGLAAAASALAVGMLRRRTRPTPTAVWGAVVATGRTMMDMLVLTAIAGIILGAVQISGLGFSLSTILLSVGGDSVFLILVMTGLVCVLLGMALPTAVIYTMLAVLVAPGLTELGVDRLAAHLFIFYMGMLSMITPPVCFASFTAATIAKASFWRTAFSGMRFGVVAYILPFVFPFSLGLIMQGDALDVLLSVATAMLGVMGLAWGLTGYVFRPIGLPVRIVLFACGIAVMPSPANGDLALAFNIAALAVGGAVVAYEWIAVRRSAQAPGLAPTGQGAEP